MTVDAKTLYQQQVLEHAKNPKNEGKLNPHTHQARGVNPLCGDRVTVYVNMQDDRIVDVRFRAQGCAIAKASASMMTSIVRGLSVEEAKALSERLKGAVQPGDPPAVDVSADDPLEPFMGIRHFPTRTRCATLPWETLDEALDD